jgi:anti-sigma factor RsiW
MFSKHVTNNLSAYCDGEVSTDESRQISEHIMACAKCRAQFEEIKLGIRFAEQLPPLAASANLWRDLETQLDTNQNMWYQHGGG